MFWQMLTQTPMKVSLDRETKVREALSRISRSPVKVLSDGRLMVARALLTLIVSQVPSKVLRDGRLIVVRAELLKIHRNPIVCVSSEDVTAVTEEE